MAGQSPRAFERRFGLGKFWTSLANAPDFFANLEPLPDATELYDAVRHLEPVILTGLPRGDWAESQKHRWAQRHFSGVEVVTTSAALKYEHCHPGDALVDDRDKYRHLWEGVGGVFIHHKNSANSIEQLRRIGFL